jgi:Flp pilus assembly protein TadD
MLSGVRGGAGILMLRWAATILVGWMAVTAEARAACELHEIADFKVTLQGSEPLVQAKIAGEPVMMIADSGAFFSSLSRGTIGQFKLAETYGNPGAYTIGIGGKQSISITRVKSFTIADQPLRNQVFLVVDNEFGPGVAGLMGENILGLADAYYDLPDGAIKLVKPTGCDRPFILWDPAQPYSIIPLERNDSPFRAIAVEAFVNGKRIRALLDTGASTSMLSADAARRAGLNPDNAGATDGGLDRGIGRQWVATSIVPVESFKIGDEEVKHTRLRVGAMSLPDVDMLLGEDFFLSHRVYVANSQHRIYITYAGGPVFNLAAPPLPSASQTALAAPKSAGSDAKVRDGSIEPTDADGFSRRGMALASRQQFEGAVADLSRAISMAPKEARFRTERARVYLEIGKSREARADLDAALELDPGDTQALVTRAQLKLVDGDHKGAVVDLDEADRRLAPQSDMRLEMAPVYMEAGGGAAAVAQLDLWIKAHPDDNRLAHALHQRCWDRALFNVEADRAVADCDAAGRREAKDANFYENRGLAHLRVGQNDEAVADFDAALATPPPRPWSLYGRGVAKLRMGQTTQGRADLAAATSASPYIAALAKAHGLDH